MKTLDQIAAELQGYEPQALPAHTVNAFLAQLVPSPTQSEEVPLLKALGRVLAQDVVSPIDVPAHDNSAMDGYAFAGSALEAGGAVAFRSVGSALAGAPYQGLLAEGECIKIMTGAVMPEGLDTVVPQEFVQTTGDHIHLPPGLVRPGDNRRARGEDLQQGKTAL